MAEREIEHHHPNRFIAGTIGMPGERSFFLQAISNRVVNTVALEKEQVEVLAERVDELLDLVIDRTADNEHVPSEALPELVDNAELATPIDVEFRVGTMSLAWDTSESHLIVECFELTSEDTESGSSGEPGPDRNVFRVVLTGAQGREFVRRALQLVKAGRSDCPFCSLPLDPNGHLCPRANGVIR